MNLLHLLETNDHNHLKKSISERYEKNRIYFKQYHPHVYTLLEQDTHSYTLLIDSRGGNIRELQSGELLYPIEEGKHQMVHASKLIAQNPLNNPLWNTLKNILDLQKMDEVRFPLSGKMNNALIDAMLPKISARKNELHLPAGFLPSTAIYGLAGGLFLEYVNQNINHIQSLFIFEENIDFFRISCHFVDYKSLFAKVTPGSLFIFLQDVMDRKIIKQFFEKHKITSGFFLLELPLYDSPKMEEVRHMVHAEQQANLRGWGTFEDEMTGVGNHQKNAASKQGKLKIPTLAEPQKIDLPICVVGNGPSLDMLLPFLHQHRKNMVLFSAGTALKPLLKAGIRPDFQIEIERLPYLADVLQEAGLENIPLIGASIIDPSVFALAKHKYMFIRGSSSVAHFREPKRIVDFCYPVVGNTALALALHFAKTVLLCGVDAGYKKGRTKHASHSMYGKENTTLPREAKPVKGNFSDDIYTDSLFSLSREMAEYAILKHGESRVYNLSDGAYIQGAVPTRADKIHMPENSDKQKALKTIKKAFKSDAAKVYSAAGENLQESLKLYIDSIITMLSRPIRNKKELFEVLDEVVNHLYQIRHKPEKASATLLSGTLLHALNTVFMLIMHLHTDEIENEFNIMREIILSSLPCFPKQL